MLHNNIFGFGCARSCISFILVFDPVNGITEQGDFGDGHSKVERVLRNI